MNSAPLRPYRLAPILDDDLWIDADDFATIRTEVAKMRERLHRDLLPIDFRSKPRLRGAEVTFSGGAPSPREIRASAESTDRSSVIKLSPFPEFYEDISNLTDDLDEFELAMTGILAHELSHVRQWQIGGNRTRRAHAASQASHEKAQLTGLYPDYIDYVATPLELAAHATQLAAETQVQCGQDLTRRQFDEVCRRSALWRHISDHPISKPGSKLEAFWHLRRVKSRLLANGWWAYRHLAGRKSGWIYRWVHRIFA